MLDQQGGKELLQNASIGGADSLLMSSRKTTTINLLQINEEDKSGGPSRAD